jgi:hypothetical protein
MHFYSCHSDAGPIQMIKALTWQTSVIGSGSGPGFLIALVSTFVSSKLDKVFAKQDEYKINDLSQTKQNLSYFRYEKRPTFSYRYRTFLAKKGNIKNPTMVYNLV